MNLFKNENEKKFDKTRMKKEPIINNILKTHDQNIDTSESGMYNEKSEIGTNYLSPSLAY